MGKTKTAFISGVPEDEKKSSEQKLREKRERQAKKAKLDEKGKGTIAKVGLKGGEKIKVVDAGPIIKEEEKKEEETKEFKKKVRGKKYLDSKKKVNSAKKYKVDEAVKKVKETSITKFNGSIDMHIVVKKQGLSVSVTLPHSSGKEKKVEMADEKTLKKLKEGKIDFDVLLATADMMPKLVPFAKLLGPKGLMPNPKNGTLLKKAGDAKAFSSNKIIVKTEKKQPVIHVSIGKTDMDDKKIVENINSVLDAINRKQILKCVIAPTMGASVKLEI